MSARHGVILRAVIVVSIAVVAVGVTDVPSAAGDVLAHRAEDDSRRITFAGEWTYAWSPAYSGHSARTSSRPGASATMRFSGTGVTLVAPRGPYGGIAEIRLDGSRVATASLYASAATTDSVVWQSASLAQGAHEVRVVVTGQREPASAGAEVAVDRFDVAGVADVARSRRVVQSDDERVARTGSWSRRRTEGASGGVSRWASKAGARIKFTFKGRSVSWIGRKSAEHGLADVYLDGRKVATVGGAPEGFRDKTILWAASGLAYRKHTVEIRVLGKPGLSTGTAVDVDAFLIDGEPLFTPRKTPFRYPWRTYIVVDKSRFRLYWVKDRILVKSYPIAHGRKWGYTPPRVWRIDAKYRSSGVYGPRKMRMFKRVATGRGYRYVFTRYAIHGTNDPSSIGTMASAGCIRMYNRDVLELFPKVPLGTMVVTRD